MKKRRRINWQKIFCFISFIFILVCILWYGGRFIYLYLDNKKTEKNDKKVFAQTLIKDNYNSKNFKAIDGDYYFYQNAKNNYLTYSNLEFRILKVTKDNQVVLISEDNLTHLAYGEELKYEDSYITKWLNKNNDTNSGILESKLSNVDSALDKSSVCIDPVDNVEKISCKNINNDNYLSLLSVTDYIHTGSTKSFINNGEVTYLANTNKDNEVWYISDSGKLSTVPGNEIYGVKVVVTLNPNITIKDGDGSEDKPYRIDSGDNLFGSYVKLGTDIWRVYDVKDNIVKLSLNSFLKMDNEFVSRSYSNNTYYHNDTIRGSLAYYLNSTYYRSLDYSNLILNAKYSNGYYGDDNHYNYSEVINTSIDTKVANLSIGDVFLNADLNNYFLATGDSENSKKVYVVSKDGTVDTKNVSTEASVVPCISIDKSKLTLGSGSKDDPYRTE